MINNKVITRECINCKTPMAYTNFTDNNYEMYICLKCGSSEKEEIMKAVVTPEE